MMELLFAVVCGVLSPLCFACVCGHDMNSDHCLFLGGERGGVWCVRRTTEKTKIKILEQDSQNKK